ncbi:hypothetical protein [Arthrobacter sp. NPDC092385]|uniref:hypothetical protein n=1 Tax=Arthrobacter sp. NPDC092385 TaxID=3363943 RepID=UPI0037F2C3EF
MTNNYTFLNGPRHGQTLNSEEEISVLPEDGGEYRAGPPFHVTSTAASEPNIDLDSTPLEWHPAKDEDA